MGGDHGHGKISMPDWRQWRAEGTPLEFTQKRLAARGLKDPWARSVLTPTFFTADIVFCLQLCLLFLLFFLAVTRLGDTRGALLVL